MIKTRTSWQYKKLKLALANSREECAKLHGLVVQLKIIISLISNRNEESRQYLIELCEDLSKIKLPD